jgi:hypothetical protein
MENGFCLLVLAICLLCGITYEDESESYTPKSSWWCLVISTPYWDQ